MKIEFTLGQNDSMVFIKELHYNFILHHLSIGRPIDGWMNN